MRFIGSLFFFVGVFLCALDVHYMVRGYWESSALGNFYGLNLLMGIQNPRAAALFLWSAPAVMGALIYLHGERRKAVKQILKTLRQ